MKYPVYTVDDLDFYRYQLLLVKQMAARDKWSTYKETTKLLKQVIKNIKNAISNDETIELLDSAEILKNLNKYPEISLSEV